MMDWLRALLDFLEGKGERGIFYIGGSDVLPPPLKGEQEQQVLEALEQGEEWAKQRLVEHNLRLVVYIARRFENTGIHLEDLISIGSIGLIKAVNTYRLDKKIRLATYASRCIENEILMFIRKTANQKQEISLDEPINLDGDVDLMVLRQALRELPPREREIMNMRYGLEGQKELTQKEVAQKMGISQSYISRLEKRILQRLRKEFLRQTSCA